MKNCKFPLPNVDLYGPEKTYLRPEIFSEIFTRTVRNTSTNDSDPILSSLLYENQEMALLINHCPHKSQYNNHACLYDLYRFS